MSAALAIARNNLNNLTQFVQKLKPSIEIRLWDDQRDALTPSYTTLDEIKGEVSITTQADLNFEDVYISFEGSTRTYVEKIATTAPTSGKTEACQNFLRMIQPMDPQAFPQPRVLEANKKYTFPFTFVVPEALLPQACTHDKHRNLPEGAHIGLPPSLGDPTVSGSGKSLLDDMTPDMCTISYSIRCRLTSGRGATGKHMILAENGKKLRILPAVEEHPPLDVGAGSDDDYRLRKEKSIRKGFLRRTMGRLTAEAVQPKSLRLPSIRTERPSDPTTMAAVNLRFDPTDENSIPPQLNNITARLRVATFYASIPLDEIPNKSSDFHFSSVKGIFVGNVPLSSRCLANTPWERHASNEPRRRDSAWSTHSARTIPVPSSDYKGKAFYTARVVVPISLPQSNKTFVPSFHSCLISRVYALDLYISINTPKVAVTDPTIHLKLPLQISVERKPDPRQRSLIAQQARNLTPLEDDEFFAPRSVAPPSPEYTERATLSMISRSSPAPTSVSPRTSVFVPSNTQLQRPQSTEDSTPPSPGPGWTHRVSFAPDPMETTSVDQTPTQRVRMLQGTQQRFQSLSFEAEDHVEAPPGYSTVGGGRGRISSTTRSMGGI